MKRSYLLIIFLLFFACSNGYTPLRIISFNIRYDNPRDGENAWLNRKENVASMIQFHDADIAGLQEALKGQLDDLDSLLQNYDWYGVGRDDGIEAGEHMAVFYKRDRLNLLDKGTFWLSSTPETASKGWDGGSFRTVTWIKFEDKFNGMVFYHFNTHFDNAGQTARRESANLLPEKITELAGDYPVVVTGDFNVRPDSDVYSILTGVDGGESADVLIDAQSVSLFPHHGPSGTWTGFTEIDEDRRIDYIFVKGEITVLRHGFLSDTFDGRFPSDHLPVLAEVIIR